MSGNPTGVNPNFCIMAGRYPIGPNKRAWWDSDSNHDNLRAAVYEKASDYFKALNVRDTGTTVIQLTPRVDVAWTAGPDTDITTTDEASIGDLAS